MLNSTKILRYIEKNLGYRFTELEISPDEIMEDIRMFALKTYSKYFPYIVSLNVNTADKVDDKYNKIYLDTKGLEIMSINRIITGNMEYVDPTIITRPSYQPDMFSTISSMDMYSMVRNPITFRFYPPNVVELYPAVIGLANACAYVNCVHPEHFGTIPANMEEQFLKLALLEVKKSLYQMRHRFENLQTAMGDIQMFIDDLQEAEAKEEELLEYWFKMAPRQANRKRLYIY